MEVLNIQNPCSSVPDHQMGIIRALLWVLRPKQWTKNLLIFSSPIFAGNLFRHDTMILMSIAFVCFSLAASTVYIMNDIVDREKDRLHPDNCKRPIASGALGVPAAIVYSIFLFAVSLGLAYYIGVVFTAIILVYFMINVFYSLRLKHVVIVDVMIIATGFVLRAVSGAVAAGDKLTPWFILCTLMLSLFLALGKRRYELQLFNGDMSKQRKVLSYYSTALLDQLITIVTAMTIATYALYTATETSGDKRYMMLTIPFVIYGMFRYLYLIHMEKSGGKPEDILFSDKHIFITVVLYGLSVICIKRYLLS